MPCARVVIGGRLAVAQQWSIGLNLAVASSTQPTPAQMTSFAQAVYALFLSDFWSAASGPWASKHPSVGNVAQCKSYWFAVDMQLPATVTGTSTGAAVAGSASMALPPQCALVFSLLSDRAGRKGRGRVFLPIASATFGTDGTVSNIPAGAASNLAAFLTAVNGTALAGGAVTASINDRALTHSDPITSVRVDNIVDTQRRRRDKIVASSTLVAAV